MWRQAQLLKIIHRLGQRYSWPLFISWSILLLIFLGSLSYSLLSRGSKISYEVPTEEQLASLPKERAPVTQRPSSPNSSFPSSLKSPSSFPADVPQPALSKTISNPSQDTNPSNVPYFKTFSEPFQGDSSKKKVALVIVRAGINQALTQKVIDSFPPEVTLSFSPHAPYLKAQMLKAREKKHEVMLNSVFLNTQGEDRGSIALSPALSSQENQRNFELFLNMGTSYVGIANLETSPLLQSSQLKGIMQKIGVYKPLFLDASSLPQRVLKDTILSLGIPFLAADHLITSRMDPEDIDQELEHVERGLQKKSQVIVVAILRPLIVEKLESWVKTLSLKDIELVHITAMVA